MKSTKRIIWIDLEMTGLEPKTDTIMEIACIVTEPDLSVVAESEDLVISHSKQEMDDMHPWCVEQHGKSGLTQQALDSVLSLQDAETQILEFIRQHTKAGECPLAGNTIYMDKIFLLKYMPKICEHLDYHLIDVSTLNELAKRWNPEVKSAIPKKSNDHRALTDIRCSVALLKYYKEKFIISQETAVQTSQEGI